jgi:hypothetical protein
MMKLTVEIESKCQDVSSDAIAALLYELSDGLRSNTFFLLKGPPEARTVLIERSVVDNSTQSSLTGKLVATPPES